MNYDVDFAHYNNNTYSSFVLCQSPENEKKYLSSFCCRSLFIIFYDVIRKMKAAS